MGMGLGAGCSWARWAGAAQPRKWEVWGWGWGLGAPGPDGQVPPRNRSNPYLPSIRKLRQWPSQEATGPLRHASNNTDGRSQRSGDCSILRPRPGACGAAAKKVRFSLGVSARTRISARRILFYFIG